MVFIFFAFSATFIIYKVYLRTRIEHKWSHASKSV